MDSVELKLALAKSALDVDKSSGACQFKLPAARLLGQINGAPLELALTGRLSAKNDLPTLNFYNVGTWRMTGGHAYQVHAVEVNDVSLFNGHHMSLRTDDKASLTAVGPGYIFDASDILTKRKKAFEDTTEDFQKKPLEGQSFTVMHTNGVVEIFDCVGDHVKDSSAHPYILIREILESNGKGLKFTWESTSAQPRITSIQDAIGVVLTAKWDRSDPQAPKLKQLVVYPNSDEQISYDLKYETNALEVQVTKKDPFNAKTVYRIEKGEAQLKLKTTAHYGTNFNRETNETLTWSGNKPKLHTVALPGSTDRLIEDWEWKDDTSQVSLSIESDAPPLEPTEPAKKTTALKKVTKLLQKVIFKHSGGVVKSVQTTADGSTSLQTCEVTHDKQAHTVTSCVVHTVDGVEISKTESTFNSEGNLIQMRRGDEKIEWTYFNNYTHYSTTSEIGDDASTLQRILGFITLGLSSVAGNFASNKTVKYTTFKASAPNNYAKDSFNLPLDMNYPGDELGFSNHVESERVSRTNSKGEETTKITYFGYDKIPTASNPLIDRAHIVVLARKLTVWAPDVTEVDVTTAQRAIADQSIKAMVDALKVCAKSVKDDDYLREGYESSITAIEGAAKDQSERNNKGFKLNNWNNAHMTVEDFTYDTDTSSEHFSKLKSNTVYFLDNQGKKIENSEVATTFGYTTDEKSKRKLTTSIEVASAEEKLVTERVQEGFTNILVESTDASGIKTSYTYTNGALSAEKVVQGETDLSDVDINYTVEPKTRRFKVEISKAKKLNRRTMFDEHGRQLEEWTNLTGKEDDWRQRSETLLTASGSTIKTYIYCPQGNKLELSIQDFDQQGAPTRWVEHDYTASGELYDTRITEWTEDDTVATKTVVLQDSGGNMIDTRTQTKKLEANKITVKHGDFTETFNWDARKRTAQYSSAHTGYIDELQLEMTYNASGQIIKTQHSKKSKDKLTTLGVQTTEYNAHGLPQKITLDANPSLTFHYDSMDRLVKKERDGLALIYEYAKHNASPSPVSISTSVEGESTDSEDVALPTVLGTQTLDAWGRVKSQKINNTTKDYTYSGASPLTQGKPKSIANVYKGYSETWAADSRSYTEACVFATTTAASETRTLSTTHELSLRGRLIKMTDIAGQVTSYTYDAFGRMIKQASSASVTTAQFGDDGKLKTETIEDLASKRVMTISYHYDVLGREIERSFTSEGMETITLGRTLSSAGRLKKQTLKINDKAKSHEEYAYNTHGQLINWKATDTHYTRANSTITEEVFEYDGVGNITSYGHRKGGSSDIITHQRTFSESHPGLLQSNGSKVPNANGRLTFNRSYLANGQLKSTGWAKSYSQGSVDLCYTYDPSGRVRALFTSGNNDSPRGFQLHYRGDNVYARSQITTNKHFWGGVLAKTDILLNDNVGCYLRQIVSHKETGADSTKTQFELRDAAGTIFATVKPDGKMGTRHGYSPYGYRDVDAEWENWLGFKGEVIFPGSCYYLGSYRVYDAGLMTFCSPDDASPFGIGGPATYAFCAGDPVNYHDPSGHSRVSHFSAVVAPPIMATKEFRIAVAVGSILTAPIGGGALAAVLGATAGGLELASVLVEDTDPQLASTLNVLSFGAGMGSIAAGIGGASRLAGAASRGASRTRVVLNKTMAGVSNYRFIDESMRLYEDTHKGLRRLVIDIHGAATATGRATGRVVTPNADLLAEDFLRLLQDTGVRIDDYDKIKLHSCFSASTYNNHGDSFAKDLARLTHKEVKGYEGEMKLTAALGETTTNPCEFVDDAVIYERLASDEGKQKLLADWRPRKVEWVCDPNGAPILDANNHGILQQYEYFRPKTFRPRNTGNNVWEIDEIAGDHTQEKLLKRYHKNSGAYGNAQQLREDRLLYLKDKNAALTKLLDGTDLT
ncbi:RHS repeat-associated core domain-containing protein [Pseudomonas putida]|uniref:RHS repeat-associated core domain-containing protein n=1 Tax=Pseudomonas putida TaxID=303 RepID=UPI001F52872E|nr:RHS repeat-associated core domain-containing protein [Pseudomonas putida]MCI0911265.1 RHS repeat-associated core domain-containing protein [Pseudomonas putida]